MTLSGYPTAQNPLILRYHRMMDAFAKSDDERDFYLDKVEGFIFFADLDKNQKELDDLDEEIAKNKERYCLIPKMTFYETKKFMEGFVNEKVYDIDTKEKLLDVIQSKEARENFLEFIYDHLTELEKWQQYYHERSRIRIIEWLRQQEILFVFEEDLDLPRQLVEKLKRHIFDVKVPKDVAQGREALVTKAKTYYSNEALNPRPKRGRPPKQVAKVEIEPQLTMDMYTTVPAPVRLFLYLPEVEQPCGRYLLRTLRHRGRSVGQLARQFAHQSRRQTRSPFAAFGIAPPLVYPSDNDPRRDFGERAKTDQSGQQRNRGRGEMKKNIQEKDAASWMWSKGFLPRKREKAKEELPSEKKAPVVKKVTQIQKKPFKKK